MPCASRNTPGSAAFSPLGAGVPEGAGRGHRRWLAVHGVQGPHTGRWNGPHAPLVLADTKYLFDTGSVVSAFDHDIAPGSKRGLEKAGTVSILDVAQDNMRGGQFASLDFLYSRIGK